MAFRNKKHGSGERGLIKRMWSYRSSYLMLLPFTLLFFLFTILPLISSVGLSFTSFNMIQLPKFVGLHNYQEILLNDEVFITSLINTLIFAVITGPVGYILSFLFAWLINELTPRIRNILTLIFYAPTLAGSVYTIWLYFFSDDEYGYINEWLTRLNIISDPVQWQSDPTYNKAVVIVVMLWLSMSTGFLAFIGGLQSLDSKLSEAGAIDGIHNRFQELIYITLPQMTPFLLFGAVMSISSAFAAGMQSIQLTGFPSTDYSTHTILLYMLDFGTLRHEMGYASSVAVILFSMMLATLWLFKKLLRRIGDT